MEIIQTADGSHTLFNEQIGENYHSKHGALAESKHVFVGMGLESWYKHNQSEVDASKNPIRILEVGFGTGLNFLTSLACANTYGFNLDYHGVEAFPLPWATIQQLGNFHDFNELSETSFGQVYEDAISLDRKIAVLDEKHALRVEVQKILDCQWTQQFDVVYFDAFAAIHQPEMWSRDVLEHVTKPLQAGGYFVTYAITGELKRTLKSLGLEIQKLPGAPGKREMLRAIKL